MSLRALLVVLIAACIFSCRQSSHEKMLRVLEQTRYEVSKPQNLYTPEAKLFFLDSILKSSTSSTDIARTNAIKGQVLLELGREEEAIEVLEKVLNQYPYAFKDAWRALGIAYFRQGERANCISNHAAESCILPIRGVAVHRDSTGSKRAIAVFNRLLSENPRDLESKWMLNLAYMTLGQYPEKVPPVFLIPNMEGDSTVKVNPFVDIAADLQIDVTDQAGGSITDDFDNDGYLDLVTSSWSLYEPMHYFRNNGDGTFTNRSEIAGLSKITGGLNIMQADYNNDGLLDILVLRGAWKLNFGNEPRSLLRNNGDGTFTDVTFDAGLFGMHPTQAATWNDFNNDGWLDLFIGNESAQTLHHPSELYMSNGDGTFREVAEIAGCKIEKFIKGVTSGDYDNDGWQDIFISTMSEQRILFRNKGVVDKEVSFADVSEKAGIATETNKTFPTWFWDYDNDGWLDVFACDYTFSATLSNYTAAEKLGLDTGIPNKMLLYHNNHDGTFTNVAAEAGLDKLAFAMGSNFGDIDNDGYLDFYLGTGNPHFQSLVPNKMYKNLGDGKFADVTRTARVGHLQKGHGVSFADLDNDGDQDIHADMGGAYKGDSYQNSLFMNPGQGNNNWINILLEGTTSNRSAIGTRIKLVVTENGKQRTIYRDVNSGGSFGASTLRREIGLGQASKIDLLEIRWHGSGKVQTFKGIDANQFIKITEGNKAIEKRNLKQIIWTLPDKWCDPVALAK